jgi:hypothetical protein
MKNKQALIVSLFLWIGCNAQQEKTYFENLSTNGIVPYDEMVLWCDSLFKLGINAIPLLIEDISREERVIIGLGSAHLSTFPSYYWEENFRGIRSAYFIELILATGMDERKSNAETSVEVQAFMKMMHNFYIYQNNILLKNDDNILDYNDIQVVKHIYSEWWEKNRFSSLENLKALYKT